MCTPNAYSVASSVGRARENGAVEGVNLNNLKDSPRKLALNGAMSFAALPGISLNTLGVIDPTKQMGKQ